MDTAPPAYVRLVLPELPPTRRTHGMGTSLLKTLMVRDRRNEIPAATFGAELRVAGALLHRGYLDPPDHPPLRRLLLRPAVEPIQYSYWQALTQDPQPQTLMSLASALTSQPISIVGRPMSTTPDPVLGRTIFADPRQYGPVDRVIASVRTAFADPFDRAVGVYLAFVICHPLSDGNGRVARALFSWSLREDGIISTPSVPLGPFFYIHARNIISITRDLVATSDWFRAIDRTFPVVKECVDFTDE